MQNYPQGLPVSEQRCEQPFVDPSTVAPPMVPSAQGIAPQVLYQYHVELMTQLQTGADRSPLRTFMFNLAAQNYFQNQYYSELLETIIQMALVMGNQPPNNLISDALLAEMSMLTTSYPALCGALSQAQLYELQQLHQHRERLAQMVRGGGQPQQPQMQGGGMYQQQQPNMGSSYGRPPMGHPTPPGRSGFPQQQSPMGVRPSTVGGQAGRTQRQPEMGQPTGMHRRGQNTSLTRTPGRSASGMVDNGQSSQPNFRKPAMESVSSTLTPNPSPQKDEAMIVADPDHRDMGHLSEVSHQKDRFPKAIDRPTNLAIYHYVPTGTFELKPVLRKVNGQDVYSLINKEHNAMDYEAHELNYSLKKFHRDGIPGPRVMEVNPEWKAISRPHTIEETDTVETVSEIPSADAVCIYGFVKAGDLQSARLAITAEAKKRGLESLEDRTLEGYVKLGKPYPAAQRDVFAIKELLEQPDLTGFVDALIEIANNEEISQGFYFAMHDRLTETMNRRLQAGLALQGWNIDSIAQDYEDLMNMLAKEVPTTSLDRFKRATLMQLKGVIEADISKANEGKIVFEERISITEVPWTSNQMGLEFKCDYTQLTAAIDVNFLAAMAHLLRRTSGKSPIQVNRRFLVTADNQWLEIHHSDIGADNVILSQF